MGKINRKRTRKVKDEEDWEDKEDNEKNEDQDECRTNKERRVTGQDEESQEQKG